MKVLDYTVDALTYNLVAKYNSLDFSKVLESDDPIEDIKLAFKDSFK